MNNVDFKQEFPDHQAKILDIAIELQKLILRIFPDTKTTFNGENVGYGFGSRYKDLAFVITPHNKLVNLGIVNGATLDDPHSLMEGKGNVHRHVKLHRIDEVRNPNHEDLMQRAHQTAQERAIS